MDQGFDGWTVLGSAFLSMGASWSGRLDRSG
jgi:hypothetical protein